MAVRQYIGARYVTKIYENSLDPSSAGWEAGVAYEPLTLVTYNNSSYLSKKDVPNSIGNPASNPTYWVLTGAYNGQILQLQNDVRTLQNDISDVNGNIFEAITNKKFAVFGDSLTTGDSHLGFTPWIVPFTNFVTDFGSTVTNYAVGGDTIPMCLTRVQAVENQLNDYDSIILFIGTNSVGDTWTNIQNDIKALATEFATHFDGDLYVITPVHANPAREIGSNLVTLGMIADCFDVNFSALERRCKVISGYGFGAFELLDTVHPSTAGSEHIYHCILEAILGQQTIYNSCVKSYMNLGWTISNATVTRSQLTPISENAIMLSLAGTYTPSDTSAFETITIPAGAEIFSNPFVGVAPVLLTITGSVATTTANAHLYLNMATPKLIFGNMTVGETYYFEANVVIPYNTNF